MKTLVSLNSPHNRGRARNKTIVQLAGYKRANATINQHLVVHSTETGMQSLLVDKQGLKIRSLLHSLSFMHTRTHINKNTSSQSVTPDWPTMFLGVISVFRTKAFYLLLKDDRVCVGV